MSARIVPSKKQNGVNENHGASTSPDRPMRPISVRSDLDDSGLSPNTFRVLGHLARRYNKDEGCAWPSYQRIGDHCFGMIFENPRTRRRAAMKAVAELESAGYIVKMARFSKQKGHEKERESNTYTLGDGGAIAPPSAIAPRGAIAPKGILIEGTPKEDSPKEKTDRQSSSSSSIPTTPGLNVGHRKTAPKPKPSHRDPPSPPVAADPPAPSPDELADVVAALCDRGICTVDDADAQAPALMALCENRAEWVIRAAGQIAEKRGVDDPLAYLRGILRNCQAEGHPPAANGNASAGRIDYSAPFDADPAPDPEFEQDPAPEPAPLPTPEPAPQPTGDSARDAWPAVLDRLSTSQPTIAEKLANTVARNGDGEVATIYGVPARELDWLGRQACGQVSKVLFFETGHRYVVEFSADPAP